MRAPDGIDHTISQGRILPLRPSLEALNQARRLNPELDQDSLHKGDTRSLETPATRLSLMNNQAADIQHQARIHQESAMRSYMPHGLGTCLTSLAGVRSNR
jgi:hypothetical protein